MLTYRKQSAIIKTTEKEKQKGAENSRQEIRERNGFQKSKKRRYGPPK